MSKPSDPTAEALDAEVQEYARQHGISYSEALAALAKTPDFLRRWTVIYPDNAERERSSMNNEAKLYWRIQRFDKEELEAYAGQRNVEFPVDEFSDMQEARNFVIEQLGLEKPEGDAPDADDDDAGSKLDKLASAYHRKHPDISYESCLGKMRLAHPDLARQYAASFPGGVSARKG